MRRSNLKAAVLLADVVGSTSLYESIGDAAALSQITDCLDTIRAIIRANGGEFIHSKGDDILCIFVDPGAALAVASQILSSPRGAISIRTGLHFGQIIRARHDIFGDVVNLTARLAAIANPGEVLASQSLVDVLSPRDKQRLALLDKMTFKGKSEPCNIFILLDEDRTFNTEISFRNAGKSQAQDAPTRTVSVTLRYNDQTKSCGNNENLTIGRSDDCDLVVQRQWVSRHHATITIANGRVRLAERSSSGTFISTHSGHEVLVRREDVLLLGSGVISPGVQRTNSDAQLIHYEVAVD